MREMFRRHRVVCYLAVTWSAWLALAATGGAVTPLYLLGLLGPLAGAIGVTAMRRERRGQPAHHVMAAEAT